VGVAARELTGSAHIWLRDMDGFDPKLLAATDDAIQPFWSPDSRSLAFFAGGAIRRLDIASGSVRTICECAPSPRGGSWSARGEILFTPGDIVYSSSHIIESEPPNLAADKLHMLMAAENVRFEDLHRAIDSFQGVKVQVVGDTIVDSYTYCTLIGGNTKTPTFSLKFEEQVDFVGGAGIVAKHLNAAGAKVTFSTVL